MRKFIFTSLLVLFAAFSSGTYAGDVFIAGFEDGETGYGVNNEGWYNGYDWSIVANSETSGKNNTDKCFMAQTNTPAAPDRWGFWVWINLEQPITITESTRYMKIMAKRSPNVTNMSVGIANDGFKENVYFGRQRPSKVGTWGDMVFDLFSGSDEKSCKNVQVQRFIVFLGTWDANGTEAGTCMLDNIVLSDNNEPRGAVKVNPGLLVNFENETLTTKNWSSFEVQSTEASYAITENPAKTSVNPTEKSLKYNKPANTTWWHSLMCFPNEVIPVAYPNIYFHIMMHIPDASPTGINISDTAGKTASSVEYPEDGTGWFDYVIDVSELSYINQVAFRFNLEQEENWNNPAGTYYVDDFVLDSNPEKREVVTPMGIKPNAIKGLKVVNENGLVCVSGANLKAASAYSITGQLVVKQPATAGSDIRFYLSKGSYIIKVEDASGAVSNVKHLTF